jgi:hypothetical protein
MANIAVSVDAKGNLVCGDIVGTLGESLTWVPDASTIRSIDSITTSVGTFNPAPSSRNNWTGTLATDGSLPSGGNGIDYTITVTASDGTQKTKAPKITVNPPEEKAVKAETSYATES